MNAPDLDSLIDDVLDGIASPDERVRLDRIIEHDPGARRRYESRALWFRTLEGPPLAEPPADLLPGVIREIANTGPAAPVSATAPRGSAKSDWLEALVTTFRVRPARAWGLVGAAAAIAATLMLVGIQPPGWRPRFGASGSIGALSSDSPVVARAALAGPDGFARLTAYQVDAGTVRIECRTKGPGGTIQFDFEPAVQRIVSLEGAEPLDGAGPSTTTTIRARVPGPGSLALVVRRDSATALRVGVTFTTSAGTRTAALPLPATRSH